MAISDSADLMFASNYRDADGEAEGEGLFFIPNETVSETRMILSNNQLLPGTTSAIRSFGLSDLRSGGEYLVHGSAAPVEGGGPTDGSVLTYLLHGRVGETPRTLVADSSLGVSGALPGSVYMAPRMGEEKYGAIVQSPNEDTALWINDEMLLEAGLEQGGSLSPRGSQILSMFPPVFGPNGLVFVEVFTVDGAEILVYGGGKFSTILATGDNVGGKKVEMLVFGGVSHSVNAQGELVAVAEFDDGTSAVLLGMPL